MKPKIALLKMFYFWISVPLVSVLFDTIALSNEILTLHQHSTCTYFFRLVPITPGDCWRNPGVSGNTRTTTAGFDRAEPSDLDRLTLWNKALYPKPNKHSWHIVFITSTLCKLCIYEAKFGILLQVLASSSLPKSFEHYNYNRWIQKFAEVYCEHIREVANHRS